MEMTTVLELALFILATAFIIISFFIVDGRNRTAKGDDKPDTVSPEQFAPIKEGFVSDLGRESTQILQECEDRLEKISNDKIIAVGEYSDQILQKIDSNHNEVVFMYEMLQKKEEELKAEAQRLDDLRIKCEQAMRSGEELQRRDVPTAVQRLTEAKAAAAAASAAAAATVSVVSAPAQTPAQNPALSESRTSAPARKPVKQRRTGVAAVAVKAPPEHSGSLGADTSMIGRNDEIISLYRSNKSVMEISKLMGMGQGEVKLIIDLYCR